MSADPAPTTELATTAEPGASADASCITCGDVAVPLTVESLDGTDARCAAPDGAVEMVATELVGPVRPGDRLLVHARVALARLDDAPEAEA